jgi:hypothetical protein
MRDVRDREILDRLAAFELQVAFAVELVRRLLRRMRGGRERQQQAKTDHKACNKTRHESDAFHAWFPLIPLIIRTFGRLGATIDGRAGAVKPSRPHPYPQRVCLENIELINCGATRMQRELQLRGDETGRVGPNTGGDKK